MLRRSIPVRRVRLHQAAIGGAVVAAALVLTSLGATVAADDRRVGAAAGAGHAIRGTITGGDAAIPLAAALVSACPVSGQFCRGSPAGAGGKYAISGLPDGSYTIEVWLAEPATYMAGYYASGAPGHFTADETHATPVRVSGGDTTGIDVTLPIGHAIRGTITGGSPAVPLTGALVSACPDAGDGRCGHASTDSHGTYAIVLVDGSYTVWLKPPEASSYLSGYYASGAPGHTTADVTQATHVGVAGADVTGIDVTLPVGHAIRGTIIGADVSAPLAGVLLHVCREDGPICLDGHIGAGGTFSIGPLANGSYTIETWLPDPATYVSGYYASGASGHFTADRGLATPVRVADVDVTRIDVTLPVGHAIRGTVSGRGAATPLAGASVTAFPVGFDGLGSPASASPFGTYAVLGLADGSYRIEVHTPDPTLFVSGWYASEAPGHYTAEYGQATRVRLAGADAAGIDVTLPARIDVHTSVAGRPEATRTVTARAKTRLTIVGTTDPALAGQILHAWIRRGGGAWSDDITRRIDAHGVARFAYIVAGDVSIQFRWPGNAAFAPATGNVVRIRAR